MRFVGRLLQRLTRAKTYAHSRHPNAGWVRGNNALCAQAKFAAAKSQLAKWVMNASTNFGRALR